jgi:hypothetical protein
MGEVEIPLYEGVQIGATLECSKSMTSNNSNWPCCLSETVIFAPFCKLCQENLFGEIPNSISKQPKFREIGCNSRTSQH